MRKKIPEALKLMVAERALFRCEYCHLPETQSFFSFQTEHIRSIKHKGNDEITNLAYACPTCNRNKGSDLATWVGEPPKLIRFFNPRTDSWKKHFSIEPTGIIVPKTKIAEGTIDILQINHPDAIIERYKLLLAEVFPLG